MQVLIIGGGIGGLTGAQGLKRAGIGVAVFERDRARGERLQGYRIHLAPYGCRALHASLPRELYGLFVATSGEPNRSLSFFDERLRNLLTLDTTEIGVDLDDPIESHKSVSRITLREVLLTGLQDVVRFGARFTHYTHEPDGRVTAHFEDGTRTTGDLLVGADGTRSRVVAQRLPDAGREETGAVAIAGKRPLDAAVADLPRQFSTGPAMVLAPGGYSGFLAFHRFRKDEYMRPVTVTSPLAGAGLLFDNTSDYVMWNVLARWEKLGGRETVEGLAPPQVRDLVLDVTKGWHPSLRRLVAESDLDTIAVLPLQTSKRPKPWTPTNVTVLGDAIHAMPPTAGAGANTAILDADTLRRRLIAAHDGRLSLEAAVGQYEAEMRAYAFKYVAAAERNLRNAINDNPVALAVARTAFSLINRIGPLRRRMTQGIAA
jgi:salicylate hydroxylase